MDKPLGTASPDHLAVSNQHPALDLWHCHKQGKIRGKKGRGRKWGGGGGRGGGAGGGAFVGEEYKEKNLTGIRFSIIFFTHNQLYGLRVAYVGED